MFSVLVELAEAESSGVTPYPFAFMRRNKGKVDPQRSKVGVLDFTERQQRRIRELDEPLTDSMYFREDLHGGARAWETWSKQASNIPNEFNSRTT